MRKRTLFILLFAAVLVLAACNGGEGAIPEADLVMTQAAELASQGLTQTAEAVSQVPPTDTPEAPTPTSIPPTPTPLPPTPTPLEEEDTGTESSTILPSPTTEPQPQDSGKPCYRASFEYETIPDGTRFPWGKVFTKTWRLKNTGSCTWKAGQLELIWVQSDFNGQEKPNLMGAPSVIVANTGASIDPNEYVTIEVNFTTPSTSGKYRVYWKLRTEGVIFDIDGGSIWVEIEAYSNE